MTHHALVFPRMGELREPQKAEQTCIPAFRAASFLHGFADKFRDVNTGTN